MTWNDFYKSVKAGQYQNVYLFTGPEEHNKREALAALRCAVLPAGLEALNDVTLEGVGAQEIIDCAETLPVMCERRIVVVRDWPPLMASKSRKAKNPEAAEEKTDGDTVRMLEWLKDPPESCILVFYMMAELDGRKKLAAALKKLDGYVEFDYLSGATLAKWCAQQLKPMGKRISADAVNEMTLMAGQDLTRLLGELQKLAAYVGDAPEIDVPAVRAVVTPSPEYSVFMILDHLLAGRLAEATQVVNSVLMNEPSAVRIISLIGNQLRIDAHMKCALEESGNTAEVERALGIKSGRAWHIKKQIGPVRANLLKELYLACVDTEYAIKSGRVQERAALNALLLKIYQAKNATK